MKVSKLIILIFFTFFIFSNVQSSQEILLNQLFGKLSNSRNFNDSSLIEKKIWKIWNKHPENIQLTEKLKFGTELMNLGDYPFALQVFNNIIKTDTEWSEVWNKRATLLFLMNDFEKSLDDIKTVLNIEPRHFGALSGQAQIYLELGKYEKAVESLKKIDKINPLSGRKEIIRSLDILIKKQSI